MARPRPTAAAVQGEPFPRIFWICAAAVCVLFFFLQWLRAAEPLGLDQGLFACFGHWTHMGWLPYRDMWDQKPPGLTHIYGLAFALFGHRTGAVWTLEGIWLAAEAVLAFLLARRLAGRWAGLAAALFVFTGLWAPRWQGYWSRAQGELWLALPALGAAWLSLDARERPLRALWAGLLLGVAGQFKMPALALAAVWPWYWIGADSWRGWLRRCLLMAAGVLLPWCVALAYFAARGGAAEFIDAVFVFPRIFFRVTGDYRNWGQVLVWVPRGVAGGMPATCLAAATALTVLAVRRDRLLWALAPWCVLPVVIVIIQGQMANYHYLLTVPSLAVTGGWGVGWIVARLGPANARGRLGGGKGSARVDQASGRGQSSQASGREPLGPANGRARLAAAVLLALLLLAGTWNLSSWRALHAANWDFRRGVIDRATYLERMRQGSFRPAVEAEMARIVRDQSAAGERLLVWGLGPGIYFLADRSPATRYPFHHLFLTGEKLSRAIPGLAQRQARFLENFDRDPPRVILVGVRDPNAFEREESYTQLVKFEALRARVQQGYELIEQTPHFLVYRRVDAAGAAEASNAAEAHETPEAAGVPKAHETNEAAP